MATLLFFMVSPSWSLPASSWLQCCHGFSYMDTLIVGAGVMSAMSASMLPWIFIHGYLQNYAERKHPELASMLPWIFIHGYMDPQRDRVHHPSGFNVAMDFHTWILAENIINDRTWNSFNVAMDFHTWILRTAEL